MLLKPCQGVDDSQEFANVIRSIRERTHAEDFLLRVRVDPAILKFTRRSIASRVHTDGRENWLDTGLFPFSLRGRLRFERGILRLVGRLGFSKSIKRFVLCRGESLHLLFRVRPGSEDPRFTSFPDHVLLLLCHKVPGEDASHLTGEILPLTEEGLLVGSFSI